MSKKINTLFAGLLAGGVLPPLALLLMHQLKWSSLSFYEFITYNHDLGSLNDILIMSLLINLIPFIVGNQHKLHQFIKGVFTMTIVYAVPLLIIYFMSK